MNLRLAAHAKINLHLDVGSRRIDGYHNIRTLFQEISLHDDLSFQTTPDPLRLTASSRKAPAGPSNLIVKALSALRKEMKVKQGLKVHLIKRIPVGAGLGGGSSDAAAALWGGWICWKKLSPRFYRKGAIPSVLKRLAPKLGADVPFFLKGGCAWAQGIGDQLKFSSVGKKMWLVLVHPRIHVSTKAAYQALDHSRRGSKRLSRPRGRFNSFEPVVMARHPEIRRVKEALTSAGAAPVMMSGSGSAVFGLVKSPAQGRRILRQIRRKRWDSFLARFL